jgi:hypothetical protein
MDSRIGRATRSDRSVTRACGPVISIFLVLSFWGVAMARPGQLGDLSASLAGASGSLAAPPVSPPAETPPSSRITPAREPNDPLFAPSPSPAAEPNQPVDALLAELNRSREDLAQRARQCQLRLMALGRGDTIKREVISAELRSIREQMCEVERQMARLSEQCHRFQDGRKEKLRAEMESIQRRLDDLDAQNQQQAKDIASALEQTRREIRVMEERLTRFGIAFTPREAPMVPYPPAASGRPLLPEVPATPAPEAEPPSARLPSPPVAEAQPEESVRELKEKIRRLQAELDAACERERAIQAQTLPSRPGSAADEFEQLRLRLDSLQSQIRQRQGVAERPAYSGSPYSIGSAGQGWVPNYGW